MAHLILTSYWRLGLLCGGFSPSDTEQATRVTIARGCLAFACAAYNPINANALIVSGERSGRRVRYQAQRDLFWFIIFAGILISLFGETGVNIVSFLLAAWVASHVITSLAAASQRALNTPRQVRTRVVRSMPQPAPSPLPPPAPVALPPPPPPTKRDRCEAARSVRDEAKRFAASESDPILRRALEAEADYQYRKTIKEIWSNP